MEEKKKRSESVGIKDRKKWVCALACLLPADWPEDSSKRVERVDSLRQTRGSKVGRWAVKGSASLAYLKFSLLLPSLVFIANCSSHSPSSQWNVRVVRLKTHFEPFH